MKKRDSLFDWHIECLMKCNNMEMRDGVPKKIEEKAIENLIEHCKLFPSFPDIQLVINISGQKYEKSECQAKIVFLPEQYKNYFDLDIRYEEPINFHTDQVNVIRKLLQAVDKNHCLVCQQVDEEKHIIIGTAPLKRFVKNLIPIIEICGHMCWRAYIGNLYLFEYKNGQYKPLRDKIDKWELREKLENRFNVLKKSPEKVKKIIEIITIISELNHGTSIIIMEQKNCQKEIAMLANEKSGHGIKLLEPIKFQSKKKSEIKSFLSQITQIDGGLIINLEAECSAIGIIFDGVVDENFQGDRGRGSRFNSVKLYVAKITSKANCLGVIVSDDGYVDII